MKKLDKQQMINGNKPQLPQPQLKSVDRPAIDEYTADEQEILAAIEAHQAVCNRLEAESSGRRQAIAQLEGRLGYIAILRNRKAVAQKETEAEVV